MLSLRDSGKIVGQSVSIRRQAERCGLPFPLSLRQFLAAPGCPFPRCNRLHLKVLVPPLIDLATMVSRMREVYATAGIRVELASREDLAGPPFESLLDFDVNEELDELFKNQNHVPAAERSREIVIYFVRSIVFGKDKPVGVAEHPAGQPGAIMGEDASLWTLAHEVGHLLLGPGHVAGEHVDCPAGDETCCSQPKRTRLMTGCGTALIEGTPTVDEDEIERMASSKLTRKC